MRIAALLLAALAGAAQARAGAAATALLAVHARLATAQASSGTTWQRVTLDFAGPSSTEGGTPNPFLDYRLDLELTHAASGHVLVVPGFFAADGQAAHTNADAGSVWRVRWTPDRPGQWRWKASFRSGSGVAVADNPLAGAPAAFDGATGSVQVAPADPNAPGFLARGALRYVGQHHLRFAGTGEPFLAGGAGSPENLLAFADFDGTDPSHHYAPHVGDWSPGDPTWDGGKGRGLVGALNYLAGQGMNAVYFLTYNVGGDGDDVWPFTAPTQRLRYDCSKLEQWEIVFDHMDRRGLLLHVVTQEQENDNGTHGLDGGSLGTQRKLYYRELVARFAHHLGVVWNLGEENTNTNGQLEAFYAHIAALDGYDHPIVVHTYPGQQDDVYEPLLEEALLEGASLQDASSGSVHASTVTWRLASAAAGKPWVVASDEIGPGDDGVLPDANDWWHDGPRRQALWGNLMGGGAGCLWYFGYDWPHDDIDCEDWRSRQHMWQLTDLALDFFRAHVPFDVAQPADERVDAPGATCLALVGQTYVVYLPDGGTTALDLGPASVGYDVRWFDPRHGGPLQTGSVPAVSGPGWRALGSPPSTPGSDWAVLVSRDNVAPAVLSLDLSPNPFPGNAPLQGVVVAQDGDGLADLAAVWLHFFTPGLAYIGAVPCQPVAPGVFAMTTPVLPPLPPGSYPVVAHALDAAGAEGFHLGWMLVP